MTTPKYDLKCLKNEKIATDIYEFHLERPAELTFEAGQFVLFDVALLDDPSDIQTRAFSIASAPNEENLIFVAKLLPSGRASNWIEQSLKPGDLVPTQGPFGRFTLKGDKDYLFVCTSTGVAPFRSQIIDSLNKGDTRRMDLIFGARTEEDLFWAEEFKQLSQKHENFFLHLAITQPSEAWTGHKGRVQTLLPLIAKDLTTKSIYICGNPDMCNELKGICQEAGVEKGDLHVEGYI